MSVGTTYGKFFLLKKLAAGGMGEIFLARQQGPAGFEKVVVIKRILSHLTESPEYLESFLQEARLQARMNHSAVVQIFDLGQAEEDGSFYLAMEYVHGKSLHELIQRLKARNERLPPALASAIIERVAEGLSYAHNLADNAGNCLNIIHRDISPHNVLVSYQGDVKLIDFGIAKSEINTHKTEAGTIKGKFFYMSPEQSAAKKIDKRSDIFSLGIVAYETLTGENPFWRPNVVHALEAIQKQDPPPLSFERPELAAFDRIIGKALAKDPEQRYSDASDFKDVLTAARVSLGPPAEKLGPLLQRVFKDKVEQENRILVDTDSASLPLKQQSSSKIKVDTGKKAGSGPKPRPGATGQEEGDEDQKLQREPTPVVELPPQKLIENAQTRLSKAPKKAKAAEPVQPEEPEGEEADESEAKAGETLVREPSSAKSAARTPAPVKSPPPAQVDKTLAEPAVEEPERPTLSLDTKGADLEDAAVIAQAKSGRGMVFLGIGVAALVAVGIGYVALSGNEDQPKQIDLAQPLVPDEAQPLKPPPQGDEPVKAAVDAKKAEEAKAVADAKAAAEAKKAEEAKAAADAKTAAEAKKAEEARAAAEAKKAADAKKAEEARAAAEAKKAADAKKAEEARVAAEAKKAADAKKAEAVKAAKVVNAGASLGTLSIRMVSPAVLKLNGKAVEGAQVTLPSAKGTIEVVAEGMPLKVSVAYGAGGAQILTDPWAIAYVNGVSKGKTPLAVPFDAEPRRIEFKRPGLDQPVSLMWKFSK